MRTRLIVIASIIGGCAAPQPASRQPFELVGRVAGAPQRCVLIRSNTSLRVADGDRHTLVYSDGRTLWANHLGPHCGFRSHDVLVTEPFGSHYCRGELVRSFDPYSKIPGPACILSDFVPYTR